MSPNIITETLKVSGMTCTSCALKIERKLQSTQGISTVNVSYVSGSVIVTYDENVINIEDIKKIVEALDYKVLNSNIRSDKKINYYNILTVVVIILLINMIIKRFGGFNIFNSFPEAEQSMGYGMLFLIGILTSVHCIAMCGGINLSQCIPNKNFTNNKSKLSTLRPSIMYNLGRVISYTIIGGMVGAIGSFISFSGTAKGIVQIGAGVFMVIMGLNMLNIFPWLRKFNPRMPKFIASKINQQKRSNSSLYVGLLNGLMPCGPLQAMQLYALSTGNPLKGALSMLIFSLGTVPLMFVLGALSSMLSKKFTHKMMTASAILVVILGVFMFNSGVGLSGFSFPSINKDFKSGNIAKISDDGVQTITTTLSPGRYESITVQKGIPVKWIIKADASNLNGCNNKIIIPKYNKEKKLEVGDNIIEFTPTDSGTVPFSCWMGMIRSKITVVDDINSTKPSSTNNKTNIEIPTDKIAFAEIKEGVQYVEIGMDDTRFTPAVLIVQNGIETVWTINGTKINSSNSSLVFPAYNAQIDMKEGSNPIKLNPSKDFYFTTIDNAFYGFVKVVDDIKNVNVEGIKTETKAFASTIEAYDINESQGSTSSGGASCH